MMTVTLRSMYSHLTIWVTSCVFTRPDNLGPQQG